MNRSFSILTKFFISFNFISSALTYGEISDHSILDQVDKVEYSLVDGLPSVTIARFSEQIGCTWSHGNVYDKGLIAKFYNLLANHHGHFVVLDVGAQTGCFTLLSKYFPNSDWHAFEPIEEVATTLSLNLKLNDIENVQVNQKAASNESSFKILKLPSMDAWGLATLGDNVLRFNTAFERIIECIDLDSYVVSKEIQKVDFIKIDTEGWELNVLHGAIKLIERDQPIILMEYNETNMRQCGIEKEQIDQFLKANGYSFELISGEDILCIPEF